LVKKFGAFNFFFGGISVCSFGGLIVDIILEVFYNVMSPSLVMSGDRSEAL